MGQSLILQMKTTCMSTESFRPGYRLSSKLSN